MVCPLEAGIPDAPLKSVDPDRPLTVMRGLWSPGATEVKFTANSPRRAPRHRGSSKTWTLKRDAKLRRDTAIEVLQNERAGHDPFRPMPIVNVRTVAADHTTFFRSSRTPNRRSSTKAAGMWVYTSGFGG